MPGSSVDSGRGITLTAGTSSWTSNITAVTFSGITREKIETTHLGTAIPSAGTFGGKTYILSDLADPGELQVEGYFNTAVSATTGAEMINTAAETWTFSLPATGSETAGKYAFSGGVTSYEISAGGYEETVNFSMTIAALGVVTATDAV